MKVLDVGSGTSILGIACIKLGAENVIAIDNDEWCFSNGKENCELNSVTKKVDVRLGEIKDIAEKKFDLITANIQKNVLVEIAGELKKRINKGGILILSGLLFTDENDILKTYTGLGFTFQEKKSLDEWIALSFVIT
jgi:ribosomal protein L11 methyltransferase